MAARTKAAKARKPRGKFGEKAEFIRKHPNLSARQLVEAAAARGLSIRTPQVYKVRSSSPARGKRSAPAKRVAAAGRHPSKSAFIRSLPLNMSAKDAVKAAAGEGIKVSETFVYNIRAAAKKRGLVPTAGSAQLGKAARRLATAPAASGADAVEFRKLAVKLGVARAKALLAEVEAGLAAIIAGG